MTCLALPWTSGLYGKSSWEKMAVRMTMNLGECLLNGIDIEMDPLTVLTGSGSVVASSMWLSSPPFMFLSFT